MFLKKFARIKAFILDVDGVLTDGSVLVTEEGNLLRSMNIKDGYAIQHAVKKGYHIMIISGGTNEGVRKRLEKLGVTEVHLGVDDKNSVLVKRLEHLGLKKEDCLSMGDDVPDLQMFAMTYCSACPADAVAEVRNQVDYISPINGGKGSVRDVIEKVMRLRNHW